VTIAITGGTGFVGQAVLDEAARRGLSVRALARRVQAPRAGVEWIAGDLADRAALARLVEGAHAVVHIAGVINAPDAAGFHAGNVAGTEALVEAAQATGTPRFICVSSLAAREPGLSDYGASKRRAEQVVEGSALDWTIVRPPAIYGPRDHEFLELFRAARWGLVPVPPRGGRASMLHVDDLARLLLDLVPGGAAGRGSVFEPDDGRAGGWVHGELGQAIGAALGRKVWTPHVPRGVLAAAARVDRLVRGSGAKLTPDRASYMAHPDWVSNPARKVPPELWQPVIETRAGLAETARWYRNAGWL